jgi:hypothetical protein
MPRSHLVLALVFLTLTAGPVSAAPVSSDLAFSVNGGGCYPTGIAPGLFDMLNLVDPEWAPLINGKTVDSTPVVVHGTVDQMHGQVGGDFPATHVESDMVAELTLDPADADLAATGNGGAHLGLEWEVGAVPDWAWAGEGDRVVALGRYIFDCGHPDPVPGHCNATTGQACVITDDCPLLCSTCSKHEACVGQHFGYESELHPPHAMAAIRDGRGGIPSDTVGAAAVPVVQADVYVSADGGGAGDRCILTHLSSSLGLLSTECFPLAEPVAPINASNFVFDLPLPPRPAGGRFAWRLISRPAPGGRAARLRVTRRLRAAAPYLRVKVLMRRRVRGEFPTGFAGTIIGGWMNDPAPLTHVRVTVQAAVINNDLQLATPIAPKQCETSGNPCDTAADCASGEACLGTGPVQGWFLQAAVNGEWQRLTGLDTATTGSVLAQDLVYDQYLPPDGGVRVVANGAARECVDTMYGKSLATDIAELGFTNGTTCLASTSHNAGTVDVSYAGPDFGAPTGSADYETPGTGGEGGTCSLTTGTSCVVDADCPSGESCITTGGAFSLRYRIERVP